MSVRYSPISAGTNTQTEAFSGGGGTLATASGVATSLGSSEGALTFQAASGVVTDPFIISNSVSGGVTNILILQPVATGASNGGRASYSFTHNS